MILDSVKHIYFLGIGGIGMSALARYFNAMGKHVSGYDKTPTKLTNELIAEGIDIHFEDDINEVNDEIKNGNQNEVLIVYTPAIPANHTELNYFKEKGFQLKKRAQVLGLITQSTRTIAVAGTHGKTTTSSLIAHILKVANLDPSAFLGGITQNYNTNLLLGKNDGSAAIVVVEADEYDRSFLTLYPDMAVITSVDADHLDIYGDKKYVEESYDLFSKQVKTTLILKKSIENKITPHKHLITYSLHDTTANYFAQNIQIKNGDYTYEITTPNTVFKNISLGLAGLHNIENSIAAVAIACLMNVSEQDIRNALKTFKGAKRRFEYHIKTDSLIFIDDYAHHPEELKAFIGSVKDMYPNKKISGIFQPHLYSRTRDFADEFAKSLDMLDQCILMEIYPAREQPINGVTSAMLLEKMILKDKRVCQKQDLLKTVLASKPEVLLTMGAGDIDTFVESLKIELLQQK
jgi:UDP-N-acetylmuramate--alanine ligase